MEQIYQISSYWHTYSKSTFVKWKFKFQPHSKSEFYVSGRIIQNSSLVHIVSYSSTTILNNNFYCRHLLHHSRDNVSKIHFLLNESELVACQNICCTLHLIKAHPVLIVNYKWFRYSVYTLTYRLSIIFCLISMTL